MVTVILKVCVHVLRSVEVDVVDGLVEELLVIIMLFERIDEVECDPETELVFEFEVDLLMVGVDVIDFEFVVVFVAVLERVDVLELEIDPENEDDPLEVFEACPDIVSLDERVKHDDCVLDFVDILINVNSGSRVYVTVTVYVINGDRDGLDVNVLFGELDELLLFLNEAVSVTVLILDGVEDELPLKVFV